MVGSEFQNFSSWLTSAQIADESTQILSFENEALFLQYLSSATYGANNSLLDAAILINNFDSINFQFDYTIRMNVSAEGDKLYTPDTRLPALIEFMNPSSPTDAQFASVQYMIDSYILWISSSSSQTPQLQYFPFPQSGKFSDDFLDLAIYVIGMLVSVSLVTFFFIIVIIIYLLFLKKFQINKLNTKIQNVHNSYRSGLSAE